MKSIVLAGLFAIGFGLATLPSASAAPAAGIGNTPAGVSLIEEAALVCRRIRVCRRTYYGRVCRYERVCRRVW